MRKMKVKNNKQLMSPKTIPQERGNSTQAAIAITSLVIVIVGACFTTDRLLYIVLIFSLYTIISALKELLFRICSVFEERKHLASRYNEDIMTLVKDLFTFSTITMVFTILSVFLVIYMVSVYGNLAKLAHEFGYIPNICALIGIGLASRLLKLDSGPLYQSTRIAELNGLDYGSGMAYSFFHGYLQIVLPHRGSEQKGIKELMEDFESTENIRFEVHKLLVLIPLSLYCPTSLQDGSKIVELSKSLPDIRYTRAGVRERVYKNTVYTIGQEKKYYVCAEYATPLQTLHDIVSHNNPHANYYKKHSKDLVLQFYLTLRAILDKNPDCGDYCDLLFFNDLDENGERLEVGYEIMNHLKKLNRKQKKLSEKTK